MTLNRLYKLNQLEILDQGVIFRNPLPGHMVVNAFLPFVHVLSDDEWLCVLRTGGAFYSRDGMLELFRSTNKGQTWERQGPIRNRAEDRMHYNYRDGCLTTLRDGTLVMRFSRTEQNDPEKLIFNDVTGGMMPREFCYMHSIDAGRTWSELVVSTFVVPFSRELEPSPLGAMIELDDGSWFQAFETWKVYDNAGPYDLNTYGLFSTDGGRTWGGRVTIAHGGSNDLSFSHGRPIRLQDGRLYIVSWTADAQMKRFYELHAVVSADNSGRVWSQPESIGIPGQTNWPVEISPGHLALIYSHREQTEQPGIKVTLSNDGGKTWDLDNQIIVWDAYGKEALGAPRTDTYPSSHDVIAYGAPQIVRLAEDELLASFWCTQGPDTHCRWCRIKVK